MNSWNIRNFDDIQEIPLERNQQRILIESLHIIETGTYGNQYIRPITINPTGDILNRLAEHAQVQSEVITPRRIAGLAGQIIQPSARPAAMAPIENGWSTPRFRFIMRVNIASANTSSSETRIYQGYTSYKGITEVFGGSPKLAEDMEFVINSSVRMNNIIYNGSVENRVISNSLILDGSVVNPLLNNGTLWTLRPMDCFQTIRSLNQSEAEKRIYSRSRLTDTATRLNNQATRISRGNTLPAKYLSGIMNAVEESNALMEFGQNDRGLLSRAFDATYESTTTDDPFISAISLAKGVLNQSSFRVGDLRSLDNTVDQRITYHAVGHTKRATLHIAGQTADWQGQSLYEQKAAFLSNTLPAIMTDFMLMEVDFSATNKTMNMQHAVRIEARPGFMGSANHEQMLKLFIQRLCNEVLPDMLGAVIIEYELRMKCRVLDDSRIMLKIDQTGPWIEFVTPTMCDNVITSLIAPKQSFLNDLATGIDSIRNKISNPLSIADTIDQDSFTVKETF